MQNDVYHYTQTAGAVQKNTVLRKTYGLLGLSFIPCAAGAFLSSQIGFNLYSMFGNRWIAFGVVLAFFYGMCFLIEKNRYSNVGAALLMVFTCGMGVLISPLLQYSLSFSNGAKIVGLAAAMTAAVFFTMAAMARRTKADMNSLGRFLIVGAVVLMVGVVANMFLQIPALGLTISAGFVIFSSLVIMWQVRTVIDGGETSHISAALTIFISLYNIFSSLLNILLSLSGED
ncbi:MULTISPECIES: Bax inhibitor-1 family protein [unclassified Neisseria]|uniref:Bax inhibitor-1 family protein n=1 Tax=unclassified Neisseria TaxID=2623750 RepID=UPI0026659312|nr:MULTISPECIES: Bax inhibitor-1 family protein [unclassified Neisseria]MDO1510349.1 Bax inhibitor-1 family protein [Neisseria sp. MVDL19-042950]MDO1516518.1 Bax inhibitor-1 family protein [Neisseria sp. MVDL18-041461]MDO1563689.1 Bax inhibitor-1 family protein [Neisseria sp. MVDL20-010259]